MRTLKSRAVSAALAFLLLATITPPASAQVPKHPLDGLTATEFWAVYDAIKTADHADARTRYPFITLHEPPKDEVLRWKPAQPFRREALVVVKEGPHTFEAIVDVAARKVTSWKEVRDVQPNVIEEEVFGINDDVKANPEWQAAMRRRGISDYDSVICYGTSPGYFGTPEDKQQRVIRVICYDRHGVWEPDGRPIEGLAVQWDANEHKVLRVIDNGIVPVPQGPVNYDIGSVVPRDAPSPLTIQQPQGPGFRVDGHQVSWQKWNFQFRIDRRVGPVISSVRYADGDNLRSILYEASLSEIFVPYMDPSETWYHWTYIDAGEFADGFASALEPGIECPENAVYFEQVFANAHAIPQRRPRAACLFERSSGDIAWRHEGLSGVESRKARELVLRSISVLGNYDYIFDWVFQQNGSIKVEIGATGVDNVKAVTARTAAEDRDGKASAYGRFVGENTVAVDHDHYFSFRLDFDIDGTTNSFVKDKLSVERQPAENPRRSVWVAKPEVARTEEQAKLHMDMAQPAAWRVVNPGVKSPLGYPVGYEIMPGDNAMPSLLPEDYPQRRAGFTDYQQWVTPYRDNERYAAGDYPVQSKGGDGLPAWTSANRPIESTDIVVWYTIGFHHVPRAEDWPVMPTMWHEFALHPVNFFARNPALDLPKQP